MTYAQFQKGLNIFHILYLYVGVSVGRLQKFEETRETI